MFRRILEAWRAWRRGEKRIAPHGVRGRVYVKRGSGSSGPNMPQKARPKGTISARVFRVATGTWEDHGVIARPMRN